jgi:membrane-associated phospholipid phosphatase
MYFDQSVLNFFVSMRTDWLIFLMLIVTYLGNAIIVAILTTFSAVSFYIHKHSVRIFPLLVSVGGSTVTVYILKILINRPRPLAIIYPEFESSFPSYHATAAIALYGFLLYTIWKFDRHILKKPFIIFLFILIAFIGISRLYLGEHYLSDVLAGYIIGFVWLFVSIKLHKYILRFPYRFGPHKSIS